MADFRRDLVAILKANGCSFVRHANRSHELWQSPVSGNRFVLQNDLNSRTAANNILKQAGLIKAF